MKWLLFLIALLCFTTELFSQEVKYAKQGDLQYEVSNASAVCTCGDDCACKTGGVCSNPSTCPMHGALKQVAPYKAVNGQVYRVVNGTSQVRVQTCNGNSCSFSWQNLNASSGSCSTSGNGSETYGGPGSRFVGVLGRLRPENWRQARSGRSAGACASCGS